MAHDRIRFDDLLARDVSVQWFEGVALVQALCRELSARSGSETQFPGASQIALGADGTVTIAGTAATKSVPAAAHLLARLMNEDTPVRLRLLVSQATAEGGTLPSLHEFSESLAYFERPNPEEILRGLYERAMVAAPATQPQAAVDFLPVEKPADAPVGEPVVKKGRNRRTAVAIGVLILLTAALLVRSGSRRGHLAAAAAGLASVVTPSVDASIEKAGASPATGTKDGGAKPATESRGHRTTSHRAGTVPPQKVGGREELPSILGPPSAALDADRVEPLTLEPVSYDAAYEVVAEAGRSSETIYSRNDPSVTPPKQVYPALPAKPSPGIRAEDLTVLDLVVSADGLVEHVHIRTPPRDVHEFMLVSAAKAWRFEPATLDGRRVRFRHSVSITTD